MKDNPLINDDLLSLEQSLRSRLNPIIPDERFVGNLRLRLEDSTIFQQQRKTAYVLLSLVSGLVVGLAIFLIGKGILYDIQQS